MLIVAEQAGLLHDRVDKCRFTVVNMGDDGDISQHESLFIERKESQII